MKNLLSGLITLGILGFVMALVAQSHSPFYTWPFWAVLVAAETFLFTLAGALRMTLMPEPAYDDTYEV